MPNLLDFSCKSPLAVAELDLYCQTEGEQRQLAEIISIAEGRHKPCGLLLSPLSTHCSVPACLYRSWPP